MKKQVDASSYTTPGGTAHRFGILDKLLRKLGSVARHGSLHQVWTKLGARHA